MGKEVVGEERKGGYGVGLWREEEREGMFWKEGCGGRGAGKEEGVTNRNRF
ncbi:hypothetical protein SAMN02745221_01663 [Thermosyntropha lipolytica DSM 11003]|uniref:Uncharacterized protein n=1 Tax=Thermosyntropha lipolytica DSM 11003 TaxID=1123382 RepID=A0A1M5Q5G2_9FIRM|nr:hypothetical protein SAMN02745221_01663 [Thermosyntropha lipolytica DSM 11003]